jgi:alpha-beta hydrolase superfamily lysophospholipase
VATSIDLTIDVTDAAGFGEPLRTRATVTLPSRDQLPTRPVVCFAFPGGGYSRRYFTFDMPGSSGGGQAGWHADRGWVFVACDHLYVGESDAPSQPGLLTLENVAAANAAMVEDITGRLLQGSLRDDFPAVDDPVRVGIGQSMGGCFTIVKQGHHETYDGVGILGYSARHTVLAMPPGTPRLPWPYVPRGSTSVQVMSAPPTDANPDFAVRGDGLPISTWGFHYDDEPEEIVRSDMDDYPTRRGRVPVWASATMPPCAVTMMSPGVVALEASVIRVPVLVAVGERDVCPTPLSEPAAYASATDVTVFVCPRMSHMHNFASTREAFWARIDSWGNGVAACTPSRAGQGR